MSMPSQHDERRTAQRGRGAVALRAGQARDGGDDRAGHRLVFSGDCLDHPLRHTVWAGRLHTADRTGCATRGPVCAVRGGVRWVEAEVSLE